MRLFGCTRLFEINRRETVDGRRWTVDGDYTLFPLTVHRLPSTVHQKKQQWVEHHVERRLTESPKVATAMAVAPLEAVIN